jgi:hypothetical protein
LAEAIAAQPRALAVWTREDLPGLWAQTQVQLAEVYMALKDWSHAATSYANVYRSFLETPARITVSVISITKNCSNLQTPLP